MRVGDEKLTIISVAVRGTNDHIRFYSQMICTAAINTSNTTRTQTGAGISKLLARPKIKMASFLGSLSASRKGSNCPR